MEIEKAFLTEPLPYVYKFLKKNKNSFIEEAEFFLNDYKPYRYKYRHLEVPKRGAGRI